MRSGDRNLRFGSTDLNFIKKLVTVKITHEIVSILLKAI